MSSHNITFTCPTPECDNYEEVYTGNHEDELFSVDGHTIVTPCFEHEEGVSEFRYDPNGVFIRSGWRYDKEGFDELGYNVNGYNRDGELN